MQVSPAALSVQLQRPLLQAQLLIPGGLHTLTTLNGFGAHGCSIGKEVGQQLGIGRVPLPLPVPAQALDGHSLTRLPVAMLLTSNR